MIELLGTYTEENASQARDDAHKWVFDTIALEWNKTVMTPQK
jgi:hypothetical protein